jgi:hypothetical protein
VRGYLKTAGNHSDDAAKLEEQPTAHSSLRNWSRGASLRYAGASPSFILYGSHAEQLVVMQPAICDTVGSVAAALAASAATGRALYSLIVALTVTLAHAVCAAGARSAADRADGNWRQRLGEPHLHRLRRARRIKLTRTGSSRVMDDVFKTEDMSE